MVWRLNFLSLFGEGSSLLKLKAEDEAVKEEVEKEKLVDNKKEEEKVVDR